MVQQAEQHRLPLCPCPCLLLSARLHLRRLMQCRISLGEASGAWEMAWHGKERWKRLAVRWKRW